MNRAARRRLPTLLFLALVVVCCLVPAQVAFGWAEGGITWDGDTMDCPACHTEEFPFATRQGPHSGYTTTTRKCLACHAVHQAAIDGIKLLPKSTIKDNCMVCHDGTGGYGVYGAIAMRGLTVGASHRIDTTNTVPGGNAATGGAADFVFTGENDFLSCDDCHNPHGADTVDPFSGERVRFHATDLGWITEWSSDKLLKRTPTGSDTTSDEYGSDWCVGCHRGRRSGLPTVMNHPTDTSATVTPPFVYDDVAIVKDDTSLETTMGTMGLLGGVPSGIWHNRGYVMPYPRTAEQTGHNPICQQCHEDSREVGTIGAVAPAQIYRYGDGRTSGDAGTDNPLFQNFPHETQNASMLVETQDDLCDNCHPAALLP